MNRTLSVMANVVGYMNVLEVIVCKYILQQTPQPRQMRLAEATADAQQCSSYGTVDSEDDKVNETLGKEAADSMVDGMKAKSAGIAAIEATQIDILKKLASMGNALATMQVDINWVREDMKVVHEVVDKVAEHVCELTDVTAEVEKLQQQTCVGPSPWGTWGDPKDGEEQQRATVDRPAPDDGDTAIHNATSHIPVAHEDVCSIWESQPIYSNVEKHAHIPSSMEEEREAGDWYSDHDGSPGMCSPPRKQTRTNAVVDSQDEETQEMVMTCNNTETSGTALVRAMWADFSTVVKEMRGTPGAGAQRKEGWVSTKRVRGSSSNSDERETQEEDAEGHENATINLNFPPENQVSPAAMCAVGRIPIYSDTAGTSRGGAKGAGRTSGRGRRPPIVAPRYHTSVVSPTSTHDMQ